MNKKGAYFHWVVLFGLLGAVVLFLAFSKEGMSSAIPVKGEWQLDFLKNNYLEAEKDLLKYDLIARKIGIEVIKEIAENGGYEPEQISECGEIDGFNLWNTEDLICFPLPKNAARKLADKKVKEKWPQESFTDVGFSKSLFTGKGEKAEIITDKAKYIYETGFAVDVGYSFEEYRDLKLDATVLVNTCWNLTDLENCLDKNKGFWKYSYCEEIDVGTYHGGVLTEEAYFEDNGKVPFCAEVNGIYHLFALDFKGNGTMFATVPTDDSTPDEVEVPEELPLMDDNFYGIEIEGNAVLVLDKSLSMKDSAVIKYLPSGFSGNVTRFQVMKQQAKEALKGISADKKFNVISFTDKVDIFEPNGMLEANSANKDVAAKYVNDLTPAGTTNVYYSLKLGISLPDVNNVYLVTDGQHNAPTKLPDFVFFSLANEARNKGIKIHTVALYGEDKFFYIPRLKEIARITGGNFVEP